MTLTKEEAKEFGIEVRAKAAGPDHARVELEFKPEGKLKSFTHVELTITEGEKSPVVFAELRENTDQFGERRRHIYSRPSLPRKDQAVGRHA